MTLPYRIARMKSPIARTCWQQAASGLDSHQHQEGLRVDRQSVQLDKMNSWTVPPNALLGPAPLTLPFINLRHTMHSGPTGPGQASVFAV